MTKEDKLNIDLDLVNAAKKLTTEGNTTDAVLYMRSDAEYQTSSINVVGNVQLLSQMILHTMKTNETFRDFFLASVGMFLTGNREVEKKFQQDLDGAKALYNLNRN